MKNPPTLTGWIRKFRLAGSGIAWAMVHEGSFRVHVPATVAAIGLAVWLELDTVRWAILVLAMAAVWTAELLNTALENLAQAVDSEFNDHIRIALDIASGAVLIASLSAVLTGVFLFGPPLWNWWTTP